MSTPKKDRFSDINEWFETLDSDDKETTIELILESYQEILDWLDDQYPFIGESFDLLQDEVHELLRDKDKKKVKTSLNHMGIKNKDLQEALLSAAHKALRFFHDAAFLREMEIIEFEQVVSKIIEDYFVRRLNSNLSSRHEYLELKDKKITDSCYRVVVNLIGRQYNLAMFLEELGDFMEEELRFNESHIELMINKILNYREQLDRYFLLQRLEKIEKKLFSLELD